MDNLLSYTVPFDLEAEQAVIGSILIDGECVPDVLRILKSDDYYSAQNREIFDTISAMHNEGKVIDPVTVLDSINDATDEQRICVRDAMMLTPTATNAVEYAQIVRDKSLLRQKQSAALQIVEQASLGDDAGIDETLNNLLEAGTQRGAEVIAADQAVKDFYTETANRQRSKAVPGLSTGFDELDELIGGLRPGNVYIVAARPGIGKSAISLNVSMNIASEGENVLFFSLEMTVPELIQRALAGHASLEMHKLRDAELDERGWEKLSSSASDISKSGLLIVENPALAVSDIARLCRCVKPKLAIVDHLGLVKPSGQNRDRREAVDGVSRSLKQMAKQLNIPVIVLAQLNRSVTSRANKTPILSDLRESGAIEQDADAVLLLHRSAYYDPNADKSTGQLIVAKNRSGQTGSIPLVWSGAYQRFSVEWTAGVRDKITSEDDNFYQEELL